MSFFHDWIGFERIIGFEVKNFKKNRDFFRYFCLWRLQNNFLTYKTRVDNEDNHDIFPTPPFSTKSDKIRESYGSMNIDFFPKN